MGRKATTGERDAYRSFVEAGPMLIAGRRAHCFIIKDLRGSLIKTPEGIAGVMVGTAY